MKKCTKCKTEKSFEEFSKNKTKKDGLTNYCKRCVKDYITINKTKLNEYNKKYNQENRDLILLKKKIYRQNNKIKCAEYSKKYRELNKEKLNKYNIEYNFNRLKNDEIFKFKNRLRNSIRTSFLRGKNQFRKDAKTEKILGCTISEFILYIQSQFKKGMTFENHGLWHLDHIIPLANATTEEEIIKLNHYTNFQPLWAKENISKGDKIIEKQLKLL